MMEDLIAIYDEGSHALIRGCSDCNPLQSRLFHRLY